MSRSLQFLERGEMQFLVDPVGELPAQSGDGHQCSLRCMRDQFKLRSTNNAVFRVS